MIEKSDAVARDIKAMARSIEALEEAGADVHTIDVSLGDRGFVRLLANGEIEFHLSHIPDEELYPGQKDPVIFKPNAEDADDVIFKLHGVVLGIRGDGVLQFLRCTQDEG